jgi:hypothetical protein
MSQRDIRFLLVALAMAMAGCGGGDAPKPVASTPGGPGAMPGANPMMPPASSNAASSTTPMGSNPMGSNPMATMPMSTPMGSTSTTSASPMSSVPGTSANPMSGYPGANPMSTTPMGATPMNTAPGASTNPMSGYPGANPMGTSPMGTTPMGSTPGVAIPMPGATTNPMGASPMPGMSGYPGVGFPAGMIPPGQFAKTPGGPLPGSFLALAQTAMKAGKEREALQYLCAHYAVHGGDDLAEKMNWVDGLKRPALAVRIGVGIVFSAPNDFRGDPQPVGRMAAAPASTTKPGEKKPRKRFGQRDQNQQQQQQAGPAATVPADAHGTLVFFTGELGEGLLDRLDERQGADGIGVALADLKEKPAAGNAAGGSDPMNMTPPMSIPMPTPGGGAGGEGANLQNREPQFLEPGIVLLGVQPDERSLKKRAKEQGVDALIIFDVEVRPAKVGNIVNNSTKMVLYSLAQDDSLITTREINNQKVADDRAKSRDTDVVETEMDRFFETFDKHYKMKELPAAITPERVVTRVRNLAKQLPDNPQALALLTEMRFYQAKGLISQVDIVMALQEALGEEQVGKLLAAETDEEKIDAFPAWFASSEDEDHASDKKKRGKD